MISHVPGKDLIIADTLSRAPTVDVTESDQLLQKETDCFVDVVVESLPATEMQLRRIQQHQEADQVCQQIVSYCKSGWPEKHQLPTAVRPYYPVASEISVEHDLLMRGSRIIIPTSLRREMLSKIHVGHQGITKCRERARQSVWWPRLSTELEELVRNCTECCKMQKQRHQPLIPTPLPELPWKKVASDLFEWKQHTYLLIVDYFSRYIEIALLSRTTAEDVITHTKSVFARHGIPETVISDNGPQFASEAYRKFAQDFQFEHITSSPYFPQSNGEAERAVKTIKNLLKKKDDPYLALLAYHATPLETGYSPSELLMNRMLRTTVPSTRKQREPGVPDIVSVRAKDKKLKSRQKKNFDSYHGARQLSPFSPGDTVWMPGRNSEALVRSSVDPRSYDVTSGNGTFRRNRKDLIALPNPNPNDSNPTDSNTNDSNTTDSNTNHSNTSDSITNNTNTDQAQPVRRSGCVSQAPDRFDPSRT